MEILIIGAEDVGSNIARDLSESHDLTIIDRDSDRIDTLTAQLDVTGAVDDGRSLMTLQEAGLEQADIVVASTDNDATNVMVCKKPHTQTVARVMNFLEKLGKDEVEQTKRRGKKLVVVDPEAADRYHDRCDRANEQPPAQSVMS